MRPQDDDWAERVSAESPQYERQTERLRRSAKGIGRKVAVSDGGSRGSEGGNFGGG